MSERVKTIGTNAILAMIFTPILLASIYWIGDKAAKVPEIEATFGVEISHLNKSLEELTSTVKENNSQLKIYTEQHTVHLSRINNSLLNQKYRLKELEKDAQENRFDIKACQKIK